MPGLVEHVEIAELRHAILQHAETETVDGSHEHGPEASEEIRAHALRYAPVYAVLELGGGSFGECEGYDRSRGGSLANDLSRAARYGLGFTGSGAGDYLQRGAAVLDGALLGCGE